VLYIFARVKRISLKPAATVEFQLESPILHAENRRSGSSGAAIEGWIVVGMEEQHIFEIRASSQSLMNLTKESVVSGQGTLPQMIRDYESGGGKINLLPDG
jgi:hypothetical protein